MTFDLAPAFNALDAIRLLNESDRLLGLGDWVTSTVKELSLDELRRNFMVCSVFDALYYDVLLPTKYASFLEYIDAIAAHSPVDLRDQIVKRWYEYTLHYPEKWNGFTLETPEQVYQDEAAFRQFHVVFIDVPDRPYIDDKLWADTFALLNHPTKLRSIVVNHLRDMWKRFYAAEWARVLPMLEESLAAFASLNNTVMEPYEAMRTVTSRDMTGKFEKHIQNARHLVFIPTTHVGPYLIAVDEDDKTYILFRARLPQPTQNPRSALSRSELLTRLNALADDTRLRIMELLTQNDEMCAQDIIEQLGLSQSSVSRHLSQLSATGYLSERRRDVGKCYSLNTERINDTLQTLKAFLNTQ